MLLEERRPESVTIEHSRFGLAVIRDQKPLSMARIATTLTDATPQEFLRFINQRVFFWPNEVRLSRMNGSPAYRDDVQLVFVVRMADVVAEHHSQIRLSPMNSGATRPFAFPRSVGMFQTIEEFERRNSDPVAEITVEVGVPNVWRLTERLEIWRGGEKVRVLRRPYNESLVRRIRK